MVDAEAILSGYCRFINNMFQKKLEIKIVS